MSQCQCTPPTQMIQRVFSFIVLVSLLRISSSYLTVSPVHCALDIIDEKRGKKASSGPSSTDMYLGQLYSVEDYRV
jgi:hypothetical protein